MIRPAVPTDAVQLAEIYRPYVLDTAVSFEETAPDPPEMQHRIETVLQMYPWLVMDSDSTIEGFAYATAHRSRPAYLWSVDTTIYVRMGSHRRGIGQALYHRLIEILTHQGFHACFAGIALPNDASVGLHEGMGFRKIGVFESVGFKRGQWRDVGWWKRALAPSAAIPSPPVPFSVWEQR